MHYCPDSPHTYSFHQVVPVGVIAITCKTTEHMRMLSCLSPINMFWVSQATYSHVSTHPFKQNGCLWFLCFTFQSMQMDVDSSVQVPEFRLHIDCTVHFAGTPHWCSEGINMHFEICDLLSHEKPDPCSTTICDYRVSCSVKFQRRGFVSKS